MLKFKDKHSYYMSGFSEEKEFPNGGSVIKLALPIEELEIAIKQMKEQGQKLVKLGVSKLKTASTNKEGKILSTHSVVYNCHPLEAVNNVDTSTGEVTTKATPAIEDGDLPF